MHIFSFNVASTNEHTTWPPFLVHVSLEGMKTDTSLPLCSGTRKHRGVGLTLFCALLLLAAFFSGQVVCCLLFIFTGYPQGHVPHIVVVIHAGFTPASLRRGSES